MIATTTEDIQKKKAVIGIDIGGTKTLMIIKSVEGKILYEETISSTPDCDLIIKLVNKGIEVCGLTQGEIKSLAVGVPARVDAIKQIVLDAPGLGWVNFSLADNLFSAFPFPCHVDNDGTMALIAEITDGHAKNACNCVMIVIGTGLGSAILVNGKIVTGAHNSAGEVGYCIFDHEEEEELLNCEGNFGYLESKISGTALASRLKDITPRELFAGYETHSEEYKQILDKFINRLSITIANLVSILDPGTVILGGGVSQSLEPFLDSIRAKVARLTPIETDIVLSKFLNQAGALGACIVAERD